MLRINNWPASRFVYGSNKRLRECERDHESSDLYRPAKVPRSKISPFEDNMSILSCIDQNAKKIVECIECEMVVDFEPSTCPDSPYIIDQRFTGYDIVDTMYLINCVLETSAKHRKSCHSCCLIPLGRSSWNMNVTVKLQCTSCPYTVDVRGIKKSENIGHQVTWATLAAGSTENNELFETKVTELYPPALQALKTIISLSPSCRPQKYSVNFFIDKIHESAECCSNNIPEIIFEILKILIEATDENVIHELYNRELGTARSSSIKNPDQIFRLLTILLSNCQKIPPDICWSLEYLQEENADRTQLFYCLEYIKEVLRKQPEMIVSEWLKRILLKNRYKSYWPEIIFSLLSTKEIESKAYSFITDPIAWKYLLFSILNDTRGLNTKIHCALIQTMVQYLVTAEKECTLDQEMYFYWTPTEATDIVQSWDVFVTILKNLDEKQSHLILPILPSLTKLKYLPQPFQYLAIIKVLQHENTLVLQWITNYVIDHLQLIEEHQHEVFDILIKMFVVDTLNNTFLYENINATALHIFLTSLPPTLKEACVTKILSQQHSSVPFYHLSKCIVDENGLIAAIEYNLASTQNLQIRSEINQLLTARLFSHLQESILASKDVSKILNQMFIRNLFNKLPLETTLKRINELRVNIPQKDFHKFLDIIKTDNYVFAVQVYNYLANECGVDYFLLADLQRYSSEVLHQNMLDKLSAFSILCPKISTIEIELFNQKFMDLLKTGQENFWEYLSVISSSPTIYIENPSIKHMHYDLIQGLKQADIVNFGFSQTYVHYSTVRMNLAAAGCDFFSQHQLEITVDLLEVGPSDILPSVMKFGMISLKNKMDPILISIAERCFVEIMGLRKNRMFWCYIERFIEFIFARELECSEWTEKVIFPKCAHLLENVSKIHGLGNLVFSNMLNQNPFDLMRPEFKDILIKGIILGDDIQTRDQRIENETIKRFGGQFSESFKTDAMVRAYCVSFLLKLQSMHQTTTSKKFLMDLHDTIVKLLFAKKQRYYANSMHHRYKMRLLQALTVLHHTKSDWNEKCLMNLCDSLEHMLLFDNDQLSISICVEFFLARHSDLEKFIEKYENSLQLKHSGIQSFIVIVWLICCWKNDKIISEKCIEKLAKYTMGPNFGVRLYSQVAVVKLIEKFHADDKALQPLYKIINSAVGFASGNNLNNFKDVLNDVRFSNIEYCHLTSLDTVFHHIPRITGMPQEEIITFEMVQQASTEIGFKLNLTRDQTLLNVPPLIRASDARIFVDQMYDPYDNVQTKITPVKTMKPQFIDSSSCDTAEYESSGGLIVVASLVSRLPNLGGLCRSCEIFAAEKLIVDNLKVIENKEFQSLSVTAEKWLTIGEVKMFQLDNYLKNMKTKGYTIIGAEQCKKSISFPNLQFPQKSVLLLGHEKEGIPANLLSLLDIAVEIPQFGVIRSLNVHVTGSLFIWKYAEQHKS